MKAAPIVPAARSPAGGAHRGPFDGMRINQAFAFQAIFCRGKPGIDPAKMNRTAISIGRAQRTGPILIEGKRWAAKHVIVTKCAGAGIGAGNLFEVVR